jgi:hypothetical protein
MPLIRLPVLETRILEPGKKPEQEAGLEKKKGLNL